MRSTVALLIALAFAASVCGEDAAPFDAAVAAYANVQLAKARELFAVAAAKDPDPHRRNRAAIQLANIEWRAYRDEDAARRALALVDMRGEEASAAHLERARIANELRHDYAASREAVARAIETAAERSQRSQAIVYRARIAVDEAQAARLAGRCSDPAPLRVAAADLRGVIERDGPTLAPTRLLLDAALITGDTAAAHDAWRWYYGAVPQVDAANRRALGLALADARFYDPEAALVLRDPCAKEPIAADAAVADVLAYAAAIRGVRDLAEEHYRTVAIGRRDDRAFRKALDDAGRSLWQSLSFPGERPPYSQQALAMELDRRFAAVINLGTTSGVFDLHYGHRVIDERREVEQYGRRGTLRFIALDGLVSNGFSLWLRDGRGGDGGWSDKGVVYQVRPLYADGPVRLWLRTADPELRAKEDREIADETKRDVARAASSPLGPFPGLTHRLSRQYGDAVMQSLRAQGLEGDALRDAFLARARDDTFASSIWAHEGRHAIDLKEGIDDSPELEFRAKLSEVALAPAPRAALIGGILVGDIATKTAHGKANRRVAEGIVAWMKTHGAEIAGLDPALPLLPQSDKMTDDQWRAAFRSMEPWLR